MRIAVVGLGMAGSTLACLLADRGLDVTVLEQEGDPRPVGAGIWLQHMGQQVLDRLGLLDDLRAVSRTVARVDIRTSTGRGLLELGYDDVPGEVAALGVHRGTLFTLLHEAVVARGVPVELDVPVTGVRPVAGGLAVETSNGDHATYDLVVGCDGSRSRVRRSMNVTVRDHAYEYGALWAIVDDPDELATDCLFQCLRGTRDYLGVLPTGRDRTSLFWSVRSDEMLAVQARGLDAWRGEARPLAAEFAPLLDRVDHLLPASYRDVVIRTPYRMTSGAGAVLVGDAAHAMSPQLGTGTSLALADAWSLHHALATAPSLGAALAAYASARRSHVRWYQWWTRLMMPVFQSGLSPLAWPRNAFAPWVTQMPWVTDQLVTTLVGDRVTPFRRWTLPELLVSARRPLVLASLTAVLSLVLLALAVRFGWLGADVDRGADFCEAAAGRVRQPVNTLSNLGFVVAGLAIARDAARLPVVGTAYACLVVFLGPASMAMHATESSLGGHLDMLSMYLVASFAVGYAAMRWWRRGPAFMGLVFVVCLAGCGVVEAVGGELPVVMHAGNLAFGILLVVALVLERRIMRRGETTVDGRWILAAAGSLGLAFAIWNTAKDGSPLCWPASVYQGHGVWHLLCALAAYCLFRFWASETRTGGEQGTVSPTATVPGSPPAGRTPDQR